jgi:predicted P-loop ATPase
VFLQGAAESDNKRYLDTVEILAFDVDDGPDPKEVFSRLKELQIGAVIYPSFRDEFEVITAKRGKLEKWVSEQKDRWSPIEEGAIASDEQILEYFKSTQPNDIAKTLHSPGTKIFGRLAGQYLVLKPSPRKYHIVIGFDRAIGPNEFGNEKWAQNQVLKSARRIVADWMGIQDDEACGTLSHVFNAHRRPAQDKDSWYLWNIEGRAIDADKLLALTWKHVRSRGKEGKQNKPASRTPNGNGSSVSNFQTGDLRADFDRFFKRHGRTFDVEGFVKTYIKDHAQQEKQVEAQCPNRDGADLDDGRVSKGHADKSGTQRKLVASNAGRSKCGKSVIDCNHNCDGLVTADYVYLIMKQNGLDISDLKEFSAPGTGDRIDDEVITQDSAFDTDRKGEMIYKTRRNLRVALAKADISVKRNSFDGELYGYGLGRYEPLIADPAMTHLRQLLREQMNFYLEKGPFYDFIEDEGERNAFHPVRERLTELRAMWDGQSRLDRLLPDYFGAQDNELNRAFSRITMTAAVRRIMEPGCKFDQILVLQSKQGMGKSTALRILALEDDWFTDSLPINPDAKVVIEQTVGSWIVEIAELAGMKKAEMEMVKAFASRQEDVARLAYGRFKTRRPRQFVLIATTNEERPFKDPTGNRRFWPVTCGQIDLEGLKRDRDQLWAEAAVLEHTGESIEFPKELYAVASDAQNSRMLEDPFIDKLKLEFGEITGKIAAERVYEILELKASMSRQYTQEAVGRAMAELGWDKKQLRYDGKRIQCFVRGGEQERQREIETLYSDNLRRRVLKDADPGNPYAELLRPQEEDEADGTSLH